MFTAAQAAQKKCRVHPLQLASFTAAQAAQKAWNEPIQAGQQFTAAQAAQKCTEKAANAREQYAYSHPEYIALLDGLKAAVEVEEQLRWAQIAAQLRVEIWRSQEASNRAQDRTMR